MILEGSYPASRVPPLLVLGVDKRDTCSYCDAPEEGCRVILEELVAASFLREEHVRYWLRRGGCLEDRTMVGRKILCSHPNASTRGTRYESIDVKLILSFLIVSAAP